MATGDYIVTMDDDIGVLPGWIENLILRLTQKNNIAAACSNVIFPNGSIQSNGGSIKVVHSREVFEYMDPGLSKNNLKTLVERDCQWLPAGVAMYRKWVFSSFPFPNDVEAYKGKVFFSHIRNSGFRLVNCPLSRVLRRQT